MTVTLKTRQVLITVSALFLAVLFCYTATAKLLNMRDFTGSMMKQELPLWTKTVLLKTLPYAEYLTVFLLSFDKTRKIGFIVSTILMSAFTIYIFLGLAHLLPHVPCTCGGVLESLTWQSHFIFNLIFLGFAITGWLLFKRNVLAQDKNENQLPSLNNF